MPFAKRLIATAATLLMAAAAADAAVVYSLAPIVGTPNQTLVSFDTATPGSVTTIGAISGATQSLDGIDFRPADGMLYGFSAATGVVFRVNPTTGATTLASTLNVPAINNPVGIDFNPAADRLRIVNADNRNLRVNVASGVTTTDGDFIYPVGDANAGANPNIVDAAYINNDNNPATATVLYYIDSLLDTLVSTTAPNGGVLGTVGALGFDTDDNVGLDIFTGASGLNSAFAKLRVGGVEGLYSIDLASGAASLIGAIGASGLRGLAVQLVPEPGSLALFGLAGMAAIALRRRRA